MSVILAVFSLLAFHESVMHIPLKTYLHISLIDLAAFLKAGSSLVKYLFQIRENWLNKSTEGLSRAAFWADFWGGIFCMAQLQIDSVMAGYPGFLTDPHVNLAKTLIAFFSLFNTGIILI